MTGFHPSPSVREDTPPSAQGNPPVVSSRTSCTCQPHTGIEYCQEGVDLLALYARAVRVNHQYGDRIPLNVAVGALGDHWGLTRKETLLVLLKQPWGVTP